MLKTSYRMLRNDIVYIYGKQPTITTQEWNRSASVAVFREYVTGLYATVYSYNYDYIFAHLSSNLFDAQSPKTNSGMIELC